MRVAIIHYWLVSMRGGERVLEQIVDMFPEADIFTHACDPAKLSAKLRNRKISTTFIGGLPLSRRFYQKYLPLMPLALEQLDLSSYDLVISCEAGPAKGVITRPDAAHVTYCHSPMRYIWDQYHQYKRLGGLAARLTMPIFAPYLRIWDTTSASRPDVILTNSRYVAKRVRKFWGRNATVVYPPVEADLYVSDCPVSDEYIWVGQLVFYKRPDLAVDAFNQSNRKLHIIGSGPMLADMKLRAGPNIRFSESLPFSELRKAYATAKALVFTAEEDFGMVPVEAMAAGRPVVAFGRGGALETVIDGHTGLFFAEATSSSVNDALTRLEEWLPTFKPAESRERAAMFSVENFRLGFMAAVREAIHAVR